MLLTVARALGLFLTRTDLGRAIRAVGQDRQVARLLGIDDRDDLQVAFGISSAALMGIAAAVLVPFFYMHPGVGTSFLLKAFVIVVLGGIGSMPGAAIGGLLVGGIEGVDRHLDLQAAVAQIVLFAVFVGVLFVRPAGLLGVEQVVTRGVTRRSRSPSAVAAARCWRSCFPLITRALLERRRLLDPDVHLGACSSPCERRPGTSSAASPASTRSATRAFVGHRRLHVLAAAI